MADKEEGIVTDDMQEALEKESNPLELEIIDLKDKLLRLAADSENLRRRYEKQIEEAREYSVVSFAKDLMSVADNLARALEHKPESQDETIKNFVTGVEMTLAELAGVFSRHSVESILPAKGDKFDYNLHHAISQVVTKEHSQGTVLQVMQVGYKIKDRLLRPAVVAVAKAPEVCTE